MTEIAIIGMACVFPGAPDLETYWRNICEGVDAITDAPPERIDGVYFDETSSATDRLYTRRGGFIDAPTFDPAAFGVMPVAAMGMEPDQLVTLNVALRAMEDAGYSSRGFARDRTSVILGRGTPEGAGYARLTNRIRVAEQLVLTLRELMPDVGEQKLAEVKARFQSQTGVFGPDTAIGLVPNLAASRIANRLNLQGSAYTVDAACASSLVAVDHACQEIASGRSDLVIAGGVHLCHQPQFWSALCQLGAVSRNQQIRPFDRRADGLLIGEGVGLLVLKDRRRAEQDGDRVYAVIRGTGVSSDGRNTSVMAPAVDGQLLALSRAWESSGLDPGSVGLIEAHGTGTGTGDAAELETLERFFGAGRPGGERIVIGSVKSMIGHAMPAAGAAGLIKAAMAVYHGVLPPSIHCEEPRDGLIDGHFELLSQAKPWEAPLRRAGVNAFGFGGINSHVIVEAAGVRRSARPARASRGTSDALLIAAGSQRELVSLLERGHSRVGVGKWRLAIFNPTPERIAAARGAVERGIRRFGRDGIFFAPGGYLSEGGKLAFLFPGVEASANLDAADLAAYMGLEAPAPRGDDVEGLGFSSFEVNALVDRTLRLIGARPDVIAGHSIGEWNGMAASGVVSEADVGTLMAGLTGAIDVPDLLFVAIGAGVETASSVIEDLPGCAVSHDNCAHQSIVCGPGSEIETVKERLRERRVLFEELPFRSGFHTPAFAPFVERHLGRFSAIDLRPAAVPLWSATTCSPYPTSRDEIAALVVRHLVEPVRFRELTSRLWEDGVRVFLQVGAGSLNAFVDDSLSGRPHNALSALSPQRPALEQARWVAAALFVEGADLELQRLGLAAQRPAGAASVTLPLGVPLIRLSAAIAPPTAEESAVAAPHPASVSQPAPSPAPVQHVVTRTFSVETFPELLDHSLFRQPPGWPVLADRAPTVPMAMLVDLMREAAEALAPGRLAVGVEQVVAGSWLLVAPPVDVAITTTQVGHDRVQVRVGEYAHGTVILGDRYPSPPPPSRKIKSRDAILLDGPAIYQQRWMFHGPAYQALESVEASDSNGMRGTVVNLPARGALLDAASQLAGLWIVQKTETDRVSMPVKVEKIEFYSPSPPLNARLECEVVIRSLGQREVRSDITLIHEGVTYCAITGSENWRFDTGGGLFAVIRQPERNVLAEVHPEGFVALTMRDMPMSELALLARRLTGAAGFETMRALPNPRRQREWLFSRIAASDAVRSYLFDQGLGPVYPLEVAIEHEGSGKPVVNVSSGRDIRISIAHTDGMAVAMATEGADPGIDVERVASRTDNFAAIAFAADEIAQLPESNRDQWLTRLWCAKEAVGKARGTGLQGTPRTLPLDRIEGTRLLIDGTWVNTRLIGEYVVAWTAQ